VETLPHHDKSGGTWLADTGMNKVGMVEEGAETCHP
jgi:hypothetical protein